MRRQSRVIVHSAAIQDRDGAGLVLDKIRRRFPFISQNWRAKPLVSYQTIVQLIAATTTDTGLTVRCELDTASYPGGISVSDEEMHQINLIRADFHGEWNDTIAPTRQQDRALAP